MLRRLALISEYASPLSALGGVDSGGQNVYVAHVGRRLAMMGWQVDVFTRRDDRRLPAIADQGGGLRIIHINAGPPESVPKEQMLPMMDDFTEEMVHFMEAEGTYDLIHANFFMSGLVAARLKKQLGLPFVVTFHSLGRVRMKHQGGSDPFPADRTAIEQRIMEEADAIIAECPQDRDDQLSLYGADPDRIRIVPCGFDAGEFWPVGRAAARRYLGLEPAGLLVVHIGRMVPRKGVDTAIQGMAHLTRRLGIPARMLVIGGESDKPDPALTPEIGRLMNVAREEGIADRIFFIGRRNRAVLHYYYSAANVFLTTPWYEPFGITPVEAMACGTPVIGSDVGGIKYSVVHNETGFLVPPHDPSAVGKRLADLLHNPGLAGRMRAAALKRVNALFTWQRVAQQIAAVYDKVLSGVERPADFADIATFEQASPALAQNQGW
jgi:D-inositol-3-phosphate glycosyltransferase